MGNNINISTSGGTFAVGNIVQGDGNTVAGTLSNRLREESFQGARAALRKLSEELRRPDAEFRSIVKQLEELKAEASGPRKQTTRAETILKTVRENFSWAYPAVKDFVAVVWPALLATLIGSSS